MVDRFLKKLVSTQEIVSRLTPEEYEEVRHCAVKWSELFLNQHAPTQPPGKLSDDFADYHGDATYPFSKPADAWQEVPVSELAAAARTGGLVSEARLQLCADGNPLLSNLRNNAVLRSVDRFLYSLKDEVQAHSRRQLAELLGKIAEDYGASTAAIFTLDSAERLEAVITHNTRKPHIEATLHDATGIVAFVARTKRGYFSNNVENEPLYRQDVLETRSEMAVPLMTPRKEVLGVLNLESREFGAFNAADIEELQAAAGCLVPHLLVLSALGRADTSWIAWHPDVCGWDLTSVFQRLCHTIAASLDRDITKCSVWYMDWPKEQLFVYATSGYDIEYMCDRLLGLDSFTGTVARSPRGTVFSVDPLQEQRFVRKDKAARMGIARALSCPIYPPGVGVMQHGISALSIYFNQDESESKAVHDAMIQVADAIGALARNFEQLRQEFALARLLHLLYEKPRASESDFEVIRDYLVEVFGADGCSIFARQAGDRKLYCIATTGLTTSRDDCSNPSDTPESSYANAEEISKGAVPIEPERSAYYDLDREGGYTVFLARNPGIVLRCNNLLDSQERGLPENLPERPLLKHRENFAPRNDENRRFLGVGIELSPGQGRSADRDTLAVVRLLRRPRSRPFTLCDERLFSVLAAACRKQFLDWRRVEAVSAASQTRRATTGLTFGGHGSSSAMRALARILRPIPAMRSTRTLVEELLIDLFECYRPYGIVHAKLLVRHSGCGPIAYRTHAFYSEPNRDFPVGEAAILPDSEASLSLVATHQSADSCLAAISFTNMTGQQFAAGLRLPVKAWTPNGLVDAVIWLDFAKPIEWNQHDIAPIFYSSCRLAALLGTTDPLGAATEVISPEVDQWEWPTMMEHFRKEAERRFHLQWSKISVGPLRCRDQWKSLDALVYKDVGLYGVRRFVDSDCLLIPLRLGPVPVGYFMCDDVLTESVDHLDQAIAGLTALWANLLFSRCASWSLEFAAEKVENNVSLWMINWQVGSDEPPLRTANDGTKRMSLFTEVPDVCFQLAAR